MATEAVNGVDYSQYSQPAELAASTPSHQASASQSSNAASSQKADPQEIGWYFVEQYYTTLSKSPDKIHLFYNKKSQLITGTEAEKVLPSVGSKAISEKIRSLDISDCKIRVLNVDSQSSYDNIVVQVIGEMSNKNQPHHKFVQTFILATQPNGYFVLNDIFRYLNEDEDEVVDDQPIPEAPTAEPELAPGEAEPVPTPAAADEIVDTESAVEQVDKELENVVDASPEAATEVNGTTDEAEETSITAPEPEAEEPADAQPAVEEPEALVEEKVEEPSPSPAPESTPAPAQTASETPAAKKPMSWASMVGIKAAPVVPAVPQAQTQAQTSTAASSQPKPRPVTTAQLPKTPTENTTEATTPTSQSNGWQEAGKKTKQQPKASEGIVHAYIKNVKDNIDARVLRETLEKYGKLKYYDVSRPKQCAFVEFEDPAAYAAAVAENPHQVGSESINVEERRPRPGVAGGFTPSYNNRGGAQAGRGRGGSQQQQQPRSGSQGSGYNRDAARGNFQGNRGNKGSGPSRGRGQAQAA